MHKRAGRVVLEEDGEPEDMVMLPLATLDVTELQDGAERRVDNTGGVTRFLQPSRRRRAI